jgi:rubrerythrin
MNSMQTICVAIILILTFIAGCGVSIDGEQSLNRGIIVNSTLEACRDVEVVRFPTQTMWKFSGILEGKTAEIGFSPTDLLDEKVVVSWTVGRQRHRVHLLLPKTNVSSPPATLAYQLLPGGRATVQVAELSDLRDTRFSRSTDRRSPNKYAMAARTTVDDVLKFAIAEEEKAEWFYTRLAEKMKVPEMREALLRFAEIERMHKGKLLAICAGGPVIGSSGEEVTNLELSDYIVDVKPTPDMQYQDALLLAIKRERASQRLYTDLAALADGDGNKSMFLALAQEERKHELRLKTEVISHLRREQYLEQKGLRNNRGQAATDGLTSP